MNSKFERAEQGFSLLELLLGVVMMAMVIVGVAALISRQGDDAKANVVALQLKTIGEAAGEYIKDAQSTLLQNTQAANSKVIITLPMLQAAGYLNTGFNVTNGYQQNTCVVVRRAPNPTNNPQLGNDLLGLVVTQGGNAVDDITLGQISATIGSGGGAVYAQNAAQVTGALGGWNFDKTLFEGATVAGLNTLPGGAQALPGGQNCSGVGNVALSVGHPTVSLWFSNGASRSASGMLYRNAVAGQPELNTMNTALLTAGPAIIPDTQIGQACNTGSTPNILGAIATAQDGSVISCVNNIWVKTDKYWGAAVDVLSDLGTCDASKAGATRMVKSTTGTAFDTHPYVPYACDGTGSWKAVGIEQDGNLALKAGDSLSIGGSKFYGDGTKTEVRQSGDFYVKDSTGTEARSIYAHWMKGNYFYPLTTSTADDPCSPNGMISKASDGSTLSCVNGVWKKATNGFTEQTVVESPTDGCGMDSPAIATCPAGYKLSGGGYRLSEWAGKQDTSNAPDSSYPRQDLNAFYVWGGGKTTDNGTALACFRAYAVCLR